MLEAIIWGLVQGLTEFLPVSSSGHLRLVPDLFGLSPPDLATSAVLHLGTLIAVIAYYRSDIAWMARGIRRDPVARRMVLMLVIATIPAVVVGITLVEAVERFQESADAVGAALIVTGAVLFSSKFVERRIRSAEEMGNRDTIVIGLAQALALLPGISRSGMVITAGIMRGLSGTQAARFGFLMAIPVTVGAGNAGSDCRGGNRRPQSRAGHRDRGGGCLGILGPIPADQGVGSPGSVAVRRLLPGGGNRRPDLALIHCRTGQSDRIPPGDPSTDPKFGMGPDTGPDRHDPVRQTVESLHRGTVRRRYADRLTAVRPGPHLGKDRDLGEQFHPGLLGQSRPASLTEDGVPLAVVAREPTHVLHHSDQLLIDRVSHPGGAGCHPTGGRLRGRHQQHPGPGARTGRSR